MHTLSKARRVVAGCSGGAIEASGEDVCGAGEDTGERGLFLPFSDTLVSLGTKLVAVIV